MIYHPLDKITREREREIGIYTQNQVKMKRKLCGVTKTVIMYYHE
jgi:hypothetical protein